MQDENWRDEIVDSAEMSVGMTVTWEILVDHIELLRRDLRLLRQEFGKLEEAFSIPPRWPING